MRRYTTCVRREKIPKAVSVIFPNSKKMLASTTDFHFCDYGLKNYRCFSYQGQYMYGCHPPSFSPLYDPRTCETGSLLLSWPCFTYTLYTLETFLRSSSSYSWTYSFCSSAWVPQVMIWCDCQQTAGGSSGVLFVGWPHFLSGAAVPPVEFWTLWNTALSTVPSVYKKNC